jgi:hypothetical protein
VTKNTLFSFWILIGALGAATYSCSSSETGSGLQLGSSGSTSVAGWSATGAGTSSSNGNTAGWSGTTAFGGATGSGGSVSIDVGTSGGSSTSDVDEHSACGTGEASAALKQVNMFVMFDRSWSMTECGTGSTGFTGGDPRCMTGPSRWALTSEALKQFFQDPGAADLRVALRFFPDDNPAPGCDGYPTTTTGGFGTPGGGPGGFMGGGGAFGGPGAPPAAAGTTGLAGSTGTAGAAATLNCDVNACSKPLVDIAPLTADPAPTDVQEQKLLDAIAASAPPDVAMLQNNPQTPTSAALAGATQWATTYETAHPDEKTVIILITDGEPQGCDTNIANIARIANDAYTKSGVATYVIGLTGSNEQTLNQIAMGGGTEKAFTVSDGNTATSDLLAKLIAIRGAAIACDFDVPKSDSAGKPVDPHLINVTYENGTTGAATQFGLVNSMADCGTGLGWYYDNPSAPTKVVLCPQSCTLVTQDNMAHLRVLAGCQPDILK